MTMRGIGTSLSFAAVTLVVLFLCAHPISAQTSNTIYGCYDRTNGSLRRVNSPAECRNTEVPVAWNIQGPKGDKGDQGLPGVKGDTGDDGAAGARGPSGFLGLRIVREYGDVTNPGEFGYANAYCDSGEVATGGGHTAETANTVTGMLMQPISSVPTAFFGGSEQGWTVYFFNVGTTTNRGIAFVVCVKVE